MIIQSGKVIIQSGKVMEEDQGKNMKQYLTSEIMEILLYKLVSATSTQCSTYSNRIKEEEQAGI